MRRWKNGFLAAVLLAGLALGLLAPASGAADGVNLMAVNDRVLEITPENMPRSAGGVLYVPYTMLSTRESGISLGVNAMYSTTKRTVLVTTDGGTRGVVFDTRANTAEDLDGNSLSVRAMVRNSMVFLPIDWLCDYFGTISCTRTATPYGTLVRVTNSAAILSDRVFVDSADNQLSGSLHRYLASGGGSQTEDPALPSGGPEPSGAPSRAELYLALRWGQEAAECARLLERQGLRGLFLFTPEEARAQDGTIRRLVGAGHTVGLALEGEDPALCLAQAEEGRTLLAAAARYAALVAAAPDLDQAGREELAGAGYAVWSATIRQEDYSSGAALVRKLDPRRMNYVELSCGRGDADFLRSALSAMEEESCLIYQATAPALA